MVRRRAGIGKSASAFGCRSRTMRGVSANAAAACPSYRTAERAECAASSFGVSDAEGGRWCGAGRASENPPPLSGVGPRLGHIRRYCREQRKRPPEGMCGMNRARLSLDVTEIRTGDSPMGSLRVSASSYSDAGRKPLPCGTTGSGALRPRPRDPFSSRMGGVRPNGFCGRMSVLSARFPDFSFFSECGLTFVS